MGELKPCPLCDDDAVIEVTVYDTVIRCDGKCGARITSDNHQNPEAVKAELIRLWNTRPADELTRLRAENEALREVLEGAGVSLRAVAGHSVQESMARDAREVSEKIKRVLFND